MRFVTKNILNPKLIVYNEWARVKHRSLKASSKFRVNRSGNGEYTVEISITTTKGRWNVPTP